MSLGRSPGCGECWGAESCRDPAPLLPLPHAAPGSPSLTGRSLFQWLLPRLGVRRRLRAGRCLPRMQERRRLLLGLLLLRRNVVLLPPAGGYRPRVPVGLHAPGSRSLRLCRGAVPVSLEPHPLSRSGAVTRKTPGTIWARKPADTEAGGRSAGTRHQLLPGPDDQPSHHEAGERSHSQALSCVVLHDAPQQQHTGRVSQSGQERSSPSLQTPSPQGGAGQSSGQLMLVS